MSDKLLRYNIAVAQAQEEQEAIDAVYEAKHSAKEGNQTFKKPAPRKQAAPKVKKVESMDEDYDAPAAAAPVVPAVSKPAPTSKCLPYLSA